MGLRRGRVLIVLRFCNENIACCFHYCTLELHMQEKRWNDYEHQKQLRVFANLKYSGMGSVSFRTRVQMPLSLQCVRGCVSVNTWEGGGGRRVRWEGFERQGFLIYCF